MGDDAEERQAGEAGVGIGSEEIFEDEYIFEDVVLFENENPSLSETCLAARGHFFGSVGYGHDVFGDEVDSRTKDLRWRSLRDRCAGEA